MNLPSLCIRRPVMTTLLTTALCVFGVMAFRYLPVNDLPSVDFPTIQVSAGLPGATPETMASAVATPLEQQFSTIAGIDSMVSTSSLGSTQITLTFTLERTSTPRHRTCRPPSLPCNVACRQTCQPRRHYRKPIPPIRLSYF